MRRILLQTLDTLADGLVPGIVVTAVAALFIVGIWRRRTVPPVTGLLVVVPYIFIIRGRIEPMLVVGLLLLLLPLMVDAGPSLLGRIGLTAPGALVVGLSTTGGLTLRLTIAAAIAIAGGLAADCADAHEGTGIGTIFLALATVGGWLDIPDVDRVLILLGAAIPVVLLVWPNPLARAGASAPLWVGALIWTAIDGGAIRLSSLVGTTAALGFLLIEPVARRSLGWDDGAFVRMWGDEPPWSTIAPSAAQATVVLLASRTAGLMRNTELAAALALTILATAFIVLRTAAPRLDLYR